MGSMSEEIKVTASLSYYQTAMVSVSVQKSQLPRHVLRRSFSAIREQFFKLFIRAVPTYQIILAFKSSTNGNVVKKLSGKTFKI